MRRNLLLFFFIAVTLISSCDFALAPSTVTSSISESKQRGFFKQEYEIDSVKTFDKHKPFIVQSAWVEKTHLSTFNFWGKETAHASNTSFQIVFNMSDDSYFKNRDFLNTWMMYDGNKDPYGLDAEMITIGLPGKSIPASIKFYVFKLKDSKLNYHQTDTVAEFILNQK